MLDPLVPLKKCHDQGLEGLGEEVALSVLGQHSVDDFLWRSKIINRFINFIGWGWLRLRWQWGFQLQKNPDTNRTWLSDWYYCYYWPDGHCAESTLSHCPSDEIRRFSWWFWTCWRETMSSIPSIVMRRSSHLWCSRYKPKQNASNIASMATDKTRVISVR